MRDWWLTLQANIRFFWILPRHILKRIKIEHDKRLKESSKKNNKQL